MCMVDAEAHTPPEGAQRPRFDQGSTERCRHVCYAACFTSTESDMATHGIHTIDTGFVRPRFDAAYLIVERGRGAFVDCGTNHAVPRMLAALDDAGLAPAAVDWLILTHVHLDHAGGAGELIARLPNAKLVVHPRGARHMIDPAKLWAGASAVYGESVMESTYGHLRPVPAERV